tara:strand:+ start:15878 stop:16213 length:336 start_codon:yes stop_codon:yes gene_type:complete
MSYDYQTYLKEDISVQTMSTASVDDRGLYDSNWSTASTVKGRLVSRESAETDGETNLDVGQFYLYLPGTTTIKTSDRVAKGSDYYDIEGIEEIKDRFGSTPIKRLTLRKSF